MPGIEQIRAVPGKRFTWKAEYTLSVLEFRKFRLFLYRLSVVVVAILGLATLLASLALNARLLMAGEWQIALPPAPGARVLWLAVILFAYAWYRLAREQAWYKPLPDTEAVEAISAEEHVTEEVWLVLEKAFRLARRFSHAQVEPLHLLIASLSFSTGRRMFARLGVDPDKLGRAMGGALGRLPHGGQRRLSDESKACFIRAAELAVSRRCRYVEMSEVAVALAEHDGLIAEVFEELGIKQQAITNITAWYALRRKLMSELRRQHTRAGYRPKRSLDRAYVAVATPFLNQLSQDLTRSASLGHLEPCVGRDQEVAESLRLLTGDHRSLVLVGGQGVGRGAILNGIAQAMAADEVPDVLKDKHLLSLSLSRLLSGASSGEAGERFYHALMEAVRAGNIVLAIESIDQLAGLRGGTEQLELTEVLASVISQHGLCVIATADEAVWRSQLESGALGQVMHKVAVEEVRDNEAIQVVESRAGHIEYDHKVVFTYASLEAAVQLSRRYMPDRHLPEKAITLLEETALYVRDLIRQPGAQVTAEHVAQVVAAKVHVPVTQVSESESEKLIHLEEIIKRRMVGQEEAVTLVAEALRRARVNLRDEKRPIASFLFLGPTGVGKTELAKTVASEYFGGEHTMVRLDMSEYQTQDSLYRLVGAPGGLGHETGLLTEAVRHNPYSLILLDELEKAHADILNVFLQVLDDGRLTDAAGRTADFTNTIIIATSNAGTQFIQESLQQNIPLEYIRRSLISGQLKQYFRPEFINRFDAVVVFEPLSMEQVAKIAKLMLDKLAKELELKGVHFSATPEAVAELAAKGFDPLYGARPLRRVMQDTVDSSLAAFLLKKKINRRDVVVLEAGGKLTVQPAARLG